MGYAIDAWIEYDDDAKYHPERAAEPPFSQVHDNCIPLEYFVGFRSSGDYQLLGAIAGIHRDEDGPRPLFSMRGGFPPNISGYTKRHVSEIVDDNDPFLSWLTYPEIEQALAHMRVQRQNLSLANNLVLDLMQSIEKRLGEGRSRLIFYIWY